MKYTVAWRETALQQLASLWIRATNRADVNRTVDDVDGELSDDPDMKGEDYFGDRYLLYPVMWVLYRVNADDQEVHVLQVGQPGIDLPHETVL